MKYRMVESIGRSNLCHIFAREFVRVSAVEGGLEIAGETASGRTLVITAIMPFAEAEYDYSQWVFESVIEPTMKFEDQGTEWEKRDEMFTCLIKSGMGFSDTMLFIEKDEGEKPSEYFIATLGVECPIRDNSFMGVRGPIVAEALKQ